MSIGEESSNPTTMPTGHRRSWTVRRMMVLIASLSLPFAGITCIVRTHDDAYSRAFAAQCSNNLKQIGLALLQYESVYGTLPPAFTTDAAGRPLLSWRVLILPFLEEQILYTRFRFDEPWDGPNNRLLLDVMPKVYACPTHRPRAWTNPIRFTSYLATTGPGTAFQGAACTKLADFLDGHDATLLAIESDQADVPWTAPVDLDARTGGLVHFKAPQPVPRGPTTPHPYHINALAADAGVFSLDATKLRRALVPASTIAGGEDLMLNDLRRDHR